MDREVWLPRLAEVRKQLEALERELIVATRRREAIARAKATAEAADRRALARQVQRLRTMLAARDA